MDQFISLNSIKELLEEPGCENVQYFGDRFPADPYEILKACCALTNRCGGQLVFGITANPPRVVVGTEAHLKSGITLEFVAEKLKMMPLTQLFEVDSKKVWVITVISRVPRLPFEFEGVPWWYENGYLIPMPEKVRHDIYFEDGYDFTSEICNDLCIDDLDDVAIDYFREKWSSNTDDSMILTLTKEQLLLKSGLLTEDGLTYAALILLGRESALQKHLPAAQILFEFRVHIGVEYPLQREELTGGFFSYFDKLWEIINMRNLKEHYLKMFSMIPVLIFNEKVVREAILNAVAHRVYKNGGRIYIRQYNTMLAIESPGTFPRGITVENIQRRRRPRNPLLVKIFSICGLIKVGEGMKLIRYFAIREGKSLPDFSGTNRGLVRLTLNCDVINRRMLGLLQDTSDDILSQLTDEDYILICKIFNGRDLEDVGLEEFAHIRELKILEPAEIFIKSPDQKTISE
ncbi:MAG: putative DNA binding domain-containing protein [Christensenellaceae bacterium]|jgi:ATP-dependent DNA helicase RecG|nr:putative DNA binding domain-containing protein [Christensenellaceae bacterium]